MYNISVELEELKNNLTNMYVAFNNLNNKSAIDNRNSDNILDVKSQFNMDRTFINSLRNNALSIFDKCNQLLLNTNVN